MSDPQHGLPQELVFEWEAEQIISRRHLTFNNLERLTRDNPWQAGTRVSQMLT
ncbi:MAG: hypothetical protein ACUVX8_12300 [Candidatus Zipacnadales bacterium]